MYQEFHMLKINIHTINQTLNKHILKFLIVLMYKNKN